MQTVLIVIHLMVVIALVAVVLLQRSEGGALGVGGGSGFMTGRGQANVLTRATAILATLFFATSLGLTLLARYSHTDQLNFNTINKNQTVLDKLKQFENKKREPPLADETKPQPQAQTPTAAPAASRTPLTTAAPATPSSIPTAQPPASSVAKPTNGDVSGQPNLPAATPVTPGQSAPAH